MCLNKYIKFIKMIAFAAVIVSLILAGGTLSSARAFTVDVKSFYYYDQFDAVSPARTINYDFSGGILSNNTIVIPDSFVTKKTADSGLSFVLTPYPVESGETNDISVALDTTGKKATLSTGTEGGCIISSTPGLPVMESASPGWTWTVQLTNFSGITDSTKEYNTQIGFGSMTPGPHPELNAYWRTGGTLGIDAVIYDDSGDGSEIWFSNEIVLTGQDPASTVLDLRIIRPLPPNAYYITFEYRLNGGAWTTIGTYEIPEADRPNQFSFPARFPFISLWEDEGESAFQVHSHHWYNNATPGDPNDTTYNSWLIVNDPGQTTYSAVSVNSPGYLVETPLVFNAAAGYWELPAAVFSDNFDDNSINSSNWSASGYSVTENEGVLKVDQAVTDAGGKVLSRAFQINPYAPIVVQRKAKVHYANNYFDGVFALVFGNTDNFASVNDAVYSVFVSHANHEYSSGTEQAVHGFYLGRYAAHFINPTVMTDPIWDAWFDEKIIYDPVSGVADLYINGMHKATINVGALPAGATYLKIYLDSWGWNTGHYNYSDDLSVSQKYSGTPVFLSDNSPPASPVTFNFTATKKDSTIETVSQQITGYVQDFATNLSPAGAITNPTPTFSWTGITGASDYAIQLYNENWNRMWNKYDIPPTINSFVYNGPALESGKTYYYDIISNIETNGMYNSSFAPGSFIYTGTAPETITVSGIVKDWNGNVIPSGVTVTLVGDSTKTTVSSTTDGSFSLPGVPANTPFSLKFSGSGYLDVYSSDLTLTADANICIDGYGGSSMYNMPTTAELTTLGAMPVSGKAVIAGRISDLTYRYSTNIGGVVVTATGNGGKNYPVTYRDPFGVLSSTPSTWGNGRYYVLNVDGGDTVTVTASKTGWVFGSCTFHTQGNAMSMSRNIGTAPGYDVSISGFVKNLAGVPIPGATIELSGDPGKSTVTNGDGSYTFSGLPRDANFYIKITAGGYVPAYAGPANFSGSFSGILITMMTSSEMTGLGVSGSNGLIGCTVFDPWGGPLSGATVTLTSKSGTVYSVNYLGGSGATSSTGKFMVPNITPGDVVRIETAKSGYAFNPVYMDGFSGAFTENNISGTELMVWNAHTSDGYFTYLDVSIGHGFTGTLPDAISAISATGPGGTVIAAKPDFTYSPQYREFFVKLPGQPSLGEYRFEVTGLPQAIIGIDNQSINREIPVPDKNTITYTPGVTPTFTWAAVNYPAAPIYYRLIINDMAGNRVYSSPRVQDMLSHTVPAGKLQADQSYQFQVRASDAPNTNLLQNESRSDYVAFNTGTAPATITVSGIVRDLNDNVITSGVTVTLVGDPAKTTVSSTTDGSFSLPGVPANTPFSLKFSGSGYLDVYTLDIGGSSSNMNISIDGYGGTSSFMMPTAAELTAQGTMPASGKAVIVGRVSDQTYRYSTNIGGVVVTATGNGGKNYPVTYRDPFGVLSSTPSTWGNGRYYVLNVDGGDTVTVTASKTGWVFGSRTFHTQGNAVSMGRVMGTAPGYDVSVSGFVRNSAGGPVSGATIELSGDPGKSTVTSGDGSYTISGLPRDANFYAKITASGCVPAYAGPVNFSGSASGAIITMMTAAEMTGSGVSGSNGLIGCTVFDAWGGPMSGATVTLTSKSGTAYSVNYLGGSGATSSTGKFMVSNITPGDVVKIEVARSGYAFNPVYMDGFSGAFTENNISGTEFMVWNAHTSDGYYTYLDISIGNGFTGTLPDAISAISVTGPGGTVIATKPDFAYYPQWREFWAQLPGQPSLGEYRFDITGLSQTVTGIDTQVVNREIPVPDKTTFTYTSGVTPTFNWAAVNYTDAPIYYRMIINDMAGNRVYSSPRVQGMVSHTVPAGKLQADQSYQFQVRVSDAPNTNLLQNESRSSYLAFNTGTTPPTITVSGIVRDLNDNVITSGVTVTLVGDSTKTTVSSTTDGSFSLSGVPANTPFSLKFSSAGYLDVYTLDIGGSSSNMNISIDGYGGTSSFMMPTVAELTTQGAMPDSGKAVIVGRISDQTYKYSTNIGGAVVTATGNGGKNYPVTYRDPFGVLSSTPSTWGNGRYYVLNVDGGDTVTVAASKTGWVFGSRTFHTQGNAVSMGRVMGTAPGYDVSVSGFVRNSAGVPIPGATIELSGDPGKYTVTNGDGSYTISGLPRDANFYARITAGGYVPAYAGPVNFSGNASGAIITMMTAAEMTGSGVSGSNGLIGCTVFDAWGGPLSGATVTLTSKSGTAYSVNYLGGSGATSSTGKFMVSNITPGDVVRIEVARSGYAFNPVYMDGFSGAFTQNNISGTELTVWNVHFSDGYYTYFDVIVGNGFTGTLPDAISAINVTGPGGTVIATKPDFTYYPQFKEFFVSLPGQPSLGEYRFEITGLPQATAGIDIQSVNREIPVPDKNTITYTPGVTPTFTWAAVNYTDAPIYYRLIINDMAGNRVYSSPRVQDMLSHTVPAGKLQADQSYRFQVRVGDAPNTNLLQNESRSDYVAFNTGTAPATITVSGIVRDLNDNVITSGVTVTLVGDPAKTTVSSTTDGSFSLSGVPASTAFSLKFSSAGYLDVYTLDIGGSSSDMNISIDGYGGTSSFMMPTAAELTAQGAMPASGKAVIVGRISDQTYKYSTSVGGVVVTATGNGGKNYPVTYRDPFGVLSSTPSTWGNGRYYVLNVDGGDTVTVAASKTGWVFGSRTFHTQGDAVSMGRIMGTAPGYDVSISGFVKNFAGGPVSGARLELNGDPNKYTFTNSDGSHTFSGLPRDANFYIKITAGGYVPAYVGPVNRLNSISGVPNVMLTAGEMNGLGVSGSNGLIICTVRDQGMNPLSGVTVTLTSKSGIAYTPVYLDGGNGATAALGNFAVSNIIPGDVVKIEAARSGYAFNPLYLDGFSGAITEKIVFGTAVQQSVLKGDLDGINGVTLSDAILAFKAMTGNTASIRANYPASGADVNGDGKVGMPEAIFIMQKISGLRLNTASGTYTYSAGTINFNWTSSDFTCEGPDLGAETQTGVTITSTTMTWPDDDNMTFNRSSGTANNIIGIWTGSDSESGNSFTITFNIDNTVSLTGVIVQCDGDDGGSNISSIKAEAQHWSGGYYVQLRGPGETATSVSVTGPGIAGSVALTYNTHMDSWGSGTPESIVNFGTAYPTGLPFTYTFTVTDGTGTWSENSTVSCFQEQFPTNISPAGTVTGTPTFSWTGVNDPSPVYGVQVNDSNGNWLWANYFISGTSIVYNGPALTPGMTYGYVVSLQSSSACNNPTSGGGSYIAGSFTYQ